MEGHGASGGSRAGRCERRIVMHGGMAAMMSGMALVWLLVIVVLVLAVAALVKYLLGR
jgi:hypothetical protein